MTIFLAELHLCLLLTNDIFFNQTIQKVVRVLSNHV